jgi:hypothetical protein
MTPAEIAARLTAAQTRALLWLPGDGSEIEHQKGAPRKVSLWAMCDQWIGAPEREAAIVYSLCRHSAAEPAREPGKVWARRRWRTTTLGREVRAIIEKEDGK